MTISLRKNRKILNDLLLTIGCASYQLGRSHTCKEDITIFLADNVNFTNTYALEINISYLDNITSANL